MKNFEEMYKEIELVREFAKDMGYPIEEVKERDRLRDDKLLTITFPTVMDSEWDEPLEYCWNLTQGKRWY